MQPTRIGLLIVTAIATACVRSPRVESAAGGEVAPTTVPASSNVLPAGATLDVTLNQQISTQSTKTGDTFSATVANAVTTQSGSVVVPAGAMVWGHVTGVKTARNATEDAAIVLDFDSLTFAGKRYPLGARVTATNLKEQRTTNPSETVKSAAIGAAAGAVLGAILSGADRDKILLGAGIGAVAGTAISLGTGDVNAVLPAGSRMTLQTTQSVAIRS